MCINILSTYVPASTCFSVEDTQCRAGKIGLGNMPGIELRRPSFNIMAQKEQVLIVPFPHNNKSLPGLPGNINIFPESDIY